METTLPTTLTEASRVKWVQFWLLQNTGAASLREVAGILHISEAALAQVVRGYKRTPALQRAIAGIAKRSLSELFGPHLSASHQKSVRARRKAG